MNRKIPRPIRVTKIRRTLLSSRIVNPKPVQKIVPRQPQRTAWPSLQDCAYVNNCSIDDIEPFVSKFRQQAISTLEIQVGDGSLLRTFEGYFRNATIYGIDKDEGALRNTSGKIKVEIGDFHRCYVGTTFYIVVGDMEVFPVLFPRLANGGVYVVKGRYSGSHHGIHSIHELPHCSIVLKS